MNDPHVRALYYQVVVAKDSDYTNAPPQSDTTAQFVLSIDGEFAVFEMKRHFSTADEARAVVDEYVRAWHMIIGLEHYPGDLRLLYHHADMIDGSPDPTADDEVNLQVHVTTRVEVSDSASLHVPRNRFPPFPAGFSASPDAEAMYDAFALYRKGRRGLAAMANMCLSTLEGAARLESVARLSEAGNQRQVKGRKEAAKQYCIDEKVLRTLGDLVANKGAPTEARKFPKDGVFEPFSPNEEEWIVSVVRALIYRTGERAHDPDAKLRQLTMEDFPDI